MQVLQDLFYVLLHCFILLVIAPLYNWTVNGGSVKWKMESALHVDEVHCKHLVSRLSTKLSCLSVTAHPDPLGVVKGVTKLRPDQSAPAGSRCARMR